MFGISSINATHDQPHIHSTQPVLVSSFPSVISRGRNSIRESVPFYAYAQTPVMVVQIGNNDNKNGNQLAPRGLGLWLDTSTTLTWARSNLCQSGNDCCYMLPMMTVKESHSNHSNPNFPSIIRKQRYTDNSEVTCKMVGETVTIGRRPMRNMGMCAAMSAHTPLLRPIDGFLGFGAAAGIPMMAARDKSVSGKNMSIEHGSATIAMSKIMLDQRKRTDDKTHFLDEPTDVLSYMLRRHYPNRPILSLWYQASLNSIEPWFNPSTVRITPLLSGAGEVILGEPNPDLYSGDLVWIPTIHPNPRDLEALREYGQWAVRLNSIVDGDGNESAITHKMTGDASIALIATAEPYILLQRDVLNQIHAERGAKVDDKTITFDCDRVKTFRPITFHFEGISVTIPWQHQYLTLRNRSTCMSVFEETPDEEPRIVLGSSFLRVMYTSFDVGSGIRSDMEGDVCKIGFAPRKDKVPVVASSPIGSRKDESSTWSSSAVSTSYPLRRNRSDVFCGRLSWMNLLVHANVLLVACWIVTLFWMN